MSARTNSFTAYALTVFALAGLVLVLLPALLPRVRLNGQLLGCMAVIQRGEACLADFDAADPASRYHLARNLLLSGQGERAVAAFLGGEPISGDPRLVSFYLGSAYRLLGDERAALETWRAADLGEYFVRRGAFAASVTDLETGIALGPQKLQDYYLLGNVLWDAGQTEQAVRAYSDGLAVEETDTIEAWVSRARLAEASKDWQSAIGMYKEVIRLEPRSYLGYIRIADLYRFPLNDGAQALAWYERCIQNAPEYIWGYLLAAEIERQNAHYDRALALAESAIPLEHSSAAPFLNMGLTWMRAGDDAQATAAFETAARLEPNNFWAPFYRGALAYENENWEEAVKYLQRSTELNPSYAGSYLMLGRSWAKFGRKTDAIAAYQQVLKLTPDNAEAKMALSQLQ